jgi:dihydroxyacid dehydratase/phosphogluconate dehydratase
MDARTRLKSRMPSRHVTEGSERAPHRSHYGAIIGGIEFTRFDVAEVFKRTPCAADLKPAGRHVAKDMFEADDVPLPMKMQPEHGFLHGNCVTATGRTVALNVECVKWNLDQDVVRLANKRLSKTCGVVGLKGNLAPAGAIVKVAGMKDLKLTGPAHGAVMHPGGAGETSCHADN